MKRTTTMAILLCFAALGAACGGEAAEPADPNAPVEHDVTAAMLEQGKVVYMTNCAPCHGETGRGDGPAAATLNPPPRDHSNSEYMDQLTDQKIADTVRMGGVISGYPNMPSSPHITGPDVPALIAYVRTLGRGPDGVSTITLEAQ